MNPKLSYEELEKKNLDLKEQVSKFLSTHNNLAKAKSRLDDELQKFQIMQSFGLSIINVESYQQFAELTLEYFIEIYNQEKGVFFHLNDHNKLEILSMYGDYSNESFQLEYCGQLLIDTVSHKCLVASDYPEIRLFDELDFADAYFSGIYNVNEELVGIICIGYSKDKAEFYDKLNLSNASSFVTFVQSVGAYYQNLKFQEKLKNEIDERKQVEKELIYSRQQIREVNEDLEQRINVRTQELNESYSKLKIQTQELKKSNDDLRRFTSIVSHDLKTPLRSIGSFAGLLRKKLDTSLDQEESGYLSIIERSAISLYRLIEDLLYYATVNAEQLELTETNVKEVVNEVLEMLETPIVDSRAVVTNKLGDVLIKCDRIKIKQVFLNIIQNAIKFSASEESKPEIRISSEVDNEQIVFSVRDNGIGIDQNFQEHVFDEFVKLNGTAYKGTGMGLSICKSIVQKHKGRIWFQDHGAGTTFNFSIPISLN